MKRKAAKFLIIVWMIIIASLTLTAFSQQPAPYLYLQEQSGFDPSTIPSGYSVVFVDTDGVLKIKAHDDSSPKLLNGINVLNDAVMVIDLTV